MIMRKAIR
jgi:ABC-type multidrug transport system fused ATPase/permease subunit